MTGNIKLERLNLLKEIGLPYDKKSKIEESIELCKEYKLDYQNYPYLVDGLSYIELFIIIMSLEKMKIPLSENGVPHEIFHMSDKEVRKNYGFGRRELVDSFFGISPKIKGV